MKLYLDKSKGARDIERVLMHTFKPTVHDVEMMEGAEKPAEKPVKSFEELLRASRIARSKSGSGEPPKT